MIRFRSIACFISLAAATAYLVPSAFAGSVELKVTGRIVPVACTPSLGAGGTVDYGTLPASSLNRTTPTKLDTREVSFTLKCDGPTKVALKLVDNQESTKVPGLGPTVLANGNDQHMMGLGQVGDKKIGAYVVRLAPDDKTIGTISSDDNGATWTTRRQGTFRKGRLLSWSTSSVPGVSPFTSFNGILSVTAVIDKGENLDVKTELSLDGKSTIEVVYL